MREVFKEWLKEFQEDAYFETFVCKGEESGPAPMNGDRFFLMEESQGDEFNALFMWSFREEEFFEWNSNGWWQKMSDEDVPDEALEIVS